MSWVKNDLIILILVTLHVENPLSIMPQTFLGVSGYFAACIHDILV